MTDVIYLVSSGQAGREEAVPARGKGVSFGGAVNMSLNLTMADSCAHSVAM